MKKIYLLFILIMIFTLDVSAQFNKAGRTSMQFLKIGIGARQVGMGEANIASVKDVNSIFWNPAAITGIDGAEASFTYTNWIGGLSVFSGAAGYNISGVGTIVLNYISLDYGDIPEALITSPGGGLDTRTGNNFSGSDLSLGFGFAREFTDKLSIGVNIRYLREDLFIYSSDLWAFDVGSFYNLGWKGIRIGMSAQNFSTPARWLETGEEVNQNHDLPLIFRIGTAIQLIGGPDLFFGGDPDVHQLSFNFDALHTNDYAERVHMGLEYWLFNILALRTGYRINYDEGNLSLGLGLKYNIGWTNLRFDYAYVNYEYLQSPHRFSVIMAF